MMKLCCNDIKFFFVFPENNIALIKIDHLLMLNLHYSKFKFVLTVQLPYIFLNTHSMPKIYYIKLQMVARWVENKIASSIDCQFFTAKCAVLVAAFSMQNGYIFVRNSHIHSIEFKDAVIPEWIDPFYFIFNLVLYSFYSLYCSKFPSADKINL